MATLPDSEVSVTQSSDTVNNKTSIAITARRDGKDRTWSGEASTTQGAVKEAVEKMLKDPRSGEYIQK